MVIEERSQHSTALHHLLQRLSLPSSLLPAPGSLISARVVLCIHVCRDHALVGCCHGVDHGAHPLGIVLRCTTRRQRATKGPRRIYRQCRDL